MARYFDRVQSQRRSNSNERRRVYGYRVWLEAKSEEYIYHIGLTGQVILCPKLIPGANNPLLMTPDGSNQDPQNQAP